MRILCQYQRRFNTGEYPCRKVLCDIQGGDVKRKENEIIIKGNGKVILKCSGCGNKTSIFYKGVEK